MRTRRGFGFEEAGLELGKFGGAREDGELPADEGRGGVRSEAVREFFRVVEDPQRRGRQGERVVDGDAVEGQTVLGLLRLAPAEDERAIVGVADAHDAVEPRGVAEVGNRNLEPTALIEAALELGLDVGRQFGAKAHGHRQREGALGIGFDEILQRGTASRGERQARGGECGLGGGLGAAKIGEPMLKGGGGGEGRVTGGFRRDEGGEGGGRSLTRGDAHGRVVGGGGAIDRTAGRRGLRRDGDRLVGSKTKGQQAQHREKENGEEAEPEKGHGERTGA